MKIEDVILDEEFEDFLPALQSDERAALKEEIERDGFTDPLIVWMNHGELIDGYNRYRIWLELGADPDKAPDIVERKFADRAAAMEWMFHHQIARRNLTAAQRAAVALKMKPAIEERAKDALVESGKATGRGNKKVLLNSTKPLDTRQEIAEIAGVSADTVRKTEAVLKDGKKKVKDAMLAGNLSANAAFKETKPATKQSAVKKAASLLAKVTGDIQRAYENLAPLVRVWDDMKRDDPAFSKKHQELLGHHSRLFQVCDDGKRIVKKLNEVWSR